MRDPHRKKSPHSPTVQAVVEAWAKQIRWPNYGGLIADVNAAIGHLHPGQVNALMTAAIVTAWRKRLAPSTAHSYRCKFANFLRTLETFGAPHIQPPRVPYPQARATVATTPELVRLLERPAPWMRLFILLYLQCGLRRAEALAVTPRTWNRENHTVTIPVKGGRIRTAEVTEDAEVLLLATFNGDPDTSCIHILHGKPICDTGIKTAWLTHRAKCGINPLVTAHDLRRTAATILYHVTHDLRVPQQLLGHKDLASTLRYIAPLAPDEARRYSELLRFDKFNSEVKQ